MPTLKLDTIHRGARAEDSDDGMRIIRVATVEDLPHSGNGFFDPSVLPAALQVAGMPQVGDPHPNHPSARLVRRISLPMESVDTVQVELHYETVQLIGSLPDNSFKIVRDSTVTTTEMTDLDYQGNPIQAKWRIPGGSGDNRYVTRNVKFPRLTPLRSVTASGLVTGRPSNNMIISVGRVNSDTFLNEPAGLWLCTGLDILTPAIGSKYAVTATWLSKMYIDWAGYGRAEDERGNAPTNTTRAQVEALRNQSYALGAPTQDAVGGLVKAALYGTANMSAIFNVSI